MKEDPNFPQTLPWPLGVPSLTPILADPTGSYTGRPLDPDDDPVQDADDL